MTRLLACPFCRELYTLGEGDRCHECGVELAPLEKLPPSAEALAEAQMAQGDTGEFAPEPIPALDFPLPWYYPGRNRLALVGLSLIGLAAFFAPWVWVAKPDDQVLSAFDLARGRAGWLWGGFVGWFTLLALAASRRSVNQMRGVRVICALFASMTLVETLMLLARPPRSHPRLPVEIHWQWGLYLSLAVALLAVIASVRFGGKADDLRDLPLPGAANQTDETMH